MDSHQVRAGLGRSKEHHTQGVAFNPQEEANCAKERGVNLHDARYDEEAVPPNDEYGSHVCLAHGLHYQLACRK